MRHLELIFALVAPLVAASACRPPKWSVGQTVHTTSGPVEGHAAPVAKEVSEYLGIPYALPPVGNLRFQPPVRYTGSSKIDGKTFGPACFPSNISAYDADYPQELIDTYGITEVGRRILETITNPGIPVSEDCLSLNVWTKPQTGEKRKPVMIYIHGGSFVSGSSAVSAYNGQFFADQEDVVLVTINYRLTFFGFPGNPHGHRNLGLLDQRMAVEWVRDNIASFGGDPFRITLFGESAGGASVDHYSFAWPRDPIVSGLIPMSGTAEGITPQPAAVAAELWYNTTAALGCGDAVTPDQAAVLACMQSVPAEAIVDTLINTIESPSRMPYSPTIDGTLVFADPSDRPTAAVPMLIGTTDNEAALFRIFVPPQPGLSPDEEDAFWHGENQRGFVCPAARRAARSAHDPDGHGNGRGGKDGEGNPTWRYRWHGVFPNTELARTPPSGAYHDSEVAVLFGAVDQSLIVSTPEEEAVGRYMRGAWATFARDPARGLGRYPLKWKSDAKSNGKEKGEGKSKLKGWPMYEAGRETLIRLGWEGKAGASLVRGDLYDDGC
ncbi:Alpha/Beta hydrolase protein [Corynascus novoguineensis]|uniref:Carboxylic ester hydrolase n=1 Tax=Corynascus novoguineensis TaxID=1126955 RepID=A0AAN7CNL0_9PEZI|nr:Alpha/Beta hydrolase protein [Corynascus novoguineensis]